MPSPFPGMDPYLEDPAFWSDFHHEYVGALRHAIARQLPQPYFAKIDEHVTIVDPEARVKRLFKPDVAVVRSAAPQGEARAGVAELHEELQPQTVANVVYLDPITQSFIEVRRRTDQHLVTVIEVLSPASKNGGRGQYLDRRELLLRQSVSLVELDFLRGGRRLPFSVPLPPADYYAFVFRADRQPDCDVYHWNVRRKLPTIPVPLRPGDRDVPVDLQQVMGSAFERGGYDTMIDYSSTVPGPALAPDDVEWVAERARTSGK